MFCYKCGASKVKFGKRPKDLERPKAKNAPGPKVPKVSPPKHEVKDKEGKPSKLADLRQQLQQAKDAATRFPEAYEGVIQRLQELIDIEVANKEASTPPFFTEMQVNRKLRADERRLEIQKTQLEALNKQKEDIEKQILEKQDSMETIAARISQAKERIAKIHAPAATVGKGIESTLVHLRNTFQALTSEGQDEDSCTLATFLKPALEALEKRSQQQAPPPAPPGASGAAGPTVEMEVDEFAIKAGLSKDDILQTLTGKGLGEAAAKRQAEHLYNMATDLDPDQEIVIKKAKKSA